jgi:hypothetical protein
MTSASTEGIHHVCNTLGLDFETAAGPPWTEVASHHPRSLFDRTRTDVSGSSLSDGRPGPVRGADLSDRVDPASIPKRRSCLRSSGGGGRKPGVRSRRPGAKAVTQDRNRKPDRSLRDLDPSDPRWQAVELAQRGRMILDVSEADLDAAEATSGPFHPITWHFRSARNEARKSWERLQAEFGTAALQAALAQPPLTVLALGPHADRWTPDRQGRWPLPNVDGPTPQPILLIPIAGKTYRALRVAGTPLAPLLWRLTRLHPPLEDGPYYACRLRDGTTQCDCAGWTFAPDDVAEPPGLCKHLRALVALGWL